MNVYQVNVEPKPATSVSYNGCGRNFCIVTESIQDAMSIARTKIDTNNESVTGVYVLSSDVVIDYSHIIAGN